MDNSLIPPYTCTTKLHCTCMYICVEGMYMDMFSRLILYKVHVHYMITYKCTLHSMRTDRGLTIKPPNQYNRDMETKKGLKEDRNLVVE